MATYTLRNLTWQDVRDLPAHRTVALLPVGALEAHGPHLPLDTDVVIAEAMARAAADRLVARGYAVLLLPSLLFTPAPFAAGFPGTVSASPETARALLADIVAALAAWRIPALAIANAHFDPANIQAITTAAETIAETCRIVFPDITRRKLAQRLTDEFRSGACHAGRYETSIMLAERPEAVRDGYRTLAPVTISLSTAIRDGRRTFEEAGGHHAYFGAPAEATADEGRQIVDTLGAILEEAVVAEVPLAS